MQISEAIDLIKSEKLLFSEKQIWADLGCGSGTFTLALAELLPAESLIYAVDSSQSSLKSIPHIVQQVSIEKYLANFVSNKLPFENLNGILMANSLHFVEDKVSFIKQIQPYLKKDAQILVVEYDTDTLNTWVPYPISFKSLIELFNEFQFSVTKLNERNSIYDNGKIYSVLITQNIL